MTIGGKGQPCQWWMGKNTRLVVVKGVGTGGSCSFYLASPDPKRTTPRASNLSEPSLPRWHRNREA